MALFDGMETASKAERDKTTQDAVDAMQAFGAAAESAEVIQFSDDLLVLATELTEYLDLETSPTMLAMVVGMALQRQELIQARNEAQEPAPEEEHTPDG